MTGDDAKNTIQANDKRDFDFFDNSERLIEGHDDLQSPEGEITERRSITYMNWAKDDSRGAIRIEVNGDDVTFLGFTFTGDKALADEVFATFREIAKDGKISGGKNGEEKQLKALEIQLANKVKEAKASQGRE